MERKHDHYTRSHGGGAWAFVGYISFGILGILLGAFLVYGLFVFLLVPETLEPPLEAVNEVPEEVVPEEQLGQVQCLIDVVEDVMPAVVGVNRQVYVRRFGEESLEPAESGSGVLISDDGYIVTNHHVIDGADNISILLPDKGRYDAQLIGECY